MKLKILKWAGVLIWMTIMELFISSCFFTFTPPAQENLSPTGNKSQETTEKNRTNETEPAKISASTGHRVVPALISNRIRAVAANDEYVCVGTDRGISVLHRSSNTWQHLSIADGLASDSVNDIYIEGNQIWIATDRGVSLYDLSNGRWKNFDRKDGLLSDKVNCITPDGDYIWFGTEGGLNRYDRRIDSWAARTSQDGLSSNRISAIAVTNEYVWVGSRTEVYRRRDDERGRSRSSQGGVDRYDKATDSWNKYSRTDGLVDNEISAIAIEDNSVWFGTVSSGISIYSQTDQAFVKSFTQSDLLGSNMITDINVDGNQIWIATANAGVQRYIKSVNTWINYTTEQGLSSNHVTCVFVYRNEVWFGTYEEGLTLYDKTQNSWTIFNREIMLPGNRVSDMVEAPDRSLWVATDHGIGRLTGGQWTAFGQNSGLTSDFVTSIDAVGTTIWIGTDCGFGKFDGDRWYFFNGNGNLEDRLVLDIEVGETRGLLATRAGLYSFSVTDPEKSLQPMPGLERTRVNSIHMLSDGSGLAATSSGLWTIASKPVRIFVGNVNDAIMVQNMIFAGTVNGLMVIDGSGNRIAEYNLSDGLPSRNVKSLSYDQKRNGIWIGTPTGLAFYDLQTRKIIQPIDSEISECEINRVFTNGEKLWIGSCMGLYTVDPDTGDYSAYRAAPRRDLLQNDGSYFVVIDGDDVWFSNWYQTYNGAIFRVNRRNWSWRKYTRQIILESEDENRISRVSWIAPSEDEVWFGTDGGALRYVKSLDIWHLYGMEDGLADNVITGLTVTKSSVWATFIDGPVVSRFDRKTEKWETIEVPQSSGMPFEDVDSLVADDSEVWMGTSMSGVKRYNEETGEWYHMTVKEGLITNRVSWLAIDDDFLWIVYDSRGTTPSLSRYDRVTGEFKHFSTSDVLTDSRISRVYAEKNNVWLLYHDWRSGGITRYNRASDDWLSITPSGDFGSGVVEFAEDGDYLWLATSEEGIKRYHLTSGTWTSFTTDDGLASNSVFEHSLKVDDDYVYAATRHGLSVYNKKTERWVSYTMKRRLLDKEVFAVAVDNRYVWVGTKSGLSRYDKQYDEWQEYQRNYGWWERVDGRDYLVDNAISSLAVDDKYVWIGTREGANRYDKVADRWLEFESRNGLPSEDITCVAVDGYDIWMGTSGGLCKYPRMSDNPNAWVTYTSGVEIKPMLTSKKFANTLVSDEVWCLDVDDEFVWVGTQRGVSRYNKNDDTWDTFTTEDGLIQNTVTSIETFGDEVWFGTSGGISVYNKKTQDWVNYTTADGLPSDNITSLKSDGRYIWIGTFDSGVVKFDPKTKRWRIFNKNDGLAHNGVLSIDLDGELVWIGTQNGLSRYDTRTDSWTSYRSK